jgi:hypothetical protein
MQTSRELVAQWDWLVGEVIEYALRRRDPSLDPDALESRLLNVLAGCAERYDRRRGPFDYYARGSLYRACKRYPYMLRMDNGFEYEGSARWSLDDEDRLLLDATLNWLKARHPRAYEVAMLRAQGLTYDEMARHLGKSPSTVHERLQRARRLAREFFYEISGGRTYPRGRWHNDEDFDGKES